MRDSKFDVGYGNWLPVEPEERKEFHCCGNCSSELYVGDEAIELDNAYYCDEWCLRDGLGARQTIIESEE